MDDVLLRRLYCEMIKIRMVEEEIARLYPEQEMRCPVHLCIGQEAVAVGVSAALGKEDRVLGGHRSHGHYLAKGGALNPMMAELYGKVTGCAKGKGGSMHLVDLAVGFWGSAPIVASTIPIATGMAFASAARGESKITVAYFGEGATEEGVFHESVNFAVLKKLPIIFVCENNLYSVYSPLSVRQPNHRTVCELVKGHGIEGFQGDGNDVVEVYNLAAEAAAKARSGNGPTFLELATYRWREHCGPDFDNDIGYRTEEEFQSWVERCPIQRMEKKLTERGLLPDKDVDAVVTSIARTIDEAVAFAKASPFPSQDLLMQHVYAEDVAEEG